MSVTVTREQAESPYRVPPDWSHWIDGRWTPSTGGETLPVTDPATGAVLCRAPRGSAADVDLAVAAARRALDPWKRLPVADRRRILAGIGAGIRRRAAELARLECLSSGKPLKDAARDVEKSADAFDFYSGLADKIFGATIPISPDYLNYTIREPIGVTAHIAPWNYPLRLSVRSLAPALAAGNTAVLKPAEQTPLTGLLLGEIMASSGVPDGVYNVVSGAGEEAGAALVAHPAVNHVSFTGSVETGVLVMRAAAGNVVPVTLELGGKSPNIVFADANLDDAIEGTIKAIFTNAGQVCCAGTRLLVERSAHDGFVDRLVERTRRIRVGPGIEDPDMGPLISEAQRNRVLGYIRLGLEEGGQILCGGGPPEDPRLSGGFFVQPTLLSGVANTARVAQEEIFGPVLTIIRFEDEAEAARLANESPYGLVAGIWTNDLSRAHRLASLIDAGQVYINDFFSESVASPFGGYKRSGFGRERGLEALHHYTQVKSVCARLKG